MSEPRYVQHMSGQGEKHEVYDRNECKDIWRIYRSGITDLYLPKSEYRLCEPPEVWMDVTEQIGNERQDGPYTRWDHVEVWGMVLTVAGNSPYRLRKVQVLSGGGPGKMWTFIVERKQP